ncbi:AcrR family transcriptional regulator [Kibdelosporangium banguiense]|uniref:AcrR family transcriptional regulator n=1 Tax=Kibdelosporangium banguiense TaxID=1365924 RepID=A0ABS4TZK8_9PSEU|nr:TetR family transcriptional regulator [Kibdelosporangium banguiense]MBP2329423.1 AcrR family transcriptional regulator [Kibdelosporangium banguiense]
MAVRAARKASDVPDTRQRLVDVAVRLFTEHSFAGTSLQMIANEMGITKAAVYHHFRTREELLTAVVEPTLHELRVVIETAEAQRTPYMRAEHLLTEYADMAVRHRAVVAVLTADAGAIAMLRSHHESGDLINRQLNLLAAVSPGPAGLVNATMALAGIAAAAGSGLVNLDDNDALHHHLVEAGRRTLGLRAPRRPTHNAARMQQ